MTNYPRSNHVNQVGIIEVEMCEKGYRSGVKVQIDRVKGEVQQ